MRHLCPSRFRTRVALAALVIGSGAAAGCGSATQTARPTTATGAKTTTGPKTATGVATTTATTAAPTAPVPVAQLVTLARGALPGLGDAAVTSASVVTTTKDAAENWLEPGSVPAGASNPRAYLIVLHGRFVCLPCSRPPGAPAPRGTSAQLIWIPGKGVTDFGLTPRVPTGLTYLGRVVKLRLPKPLLVHVIGPPPIRLQPWMPLRTHPRTLPRAAPVTPSRTVTPSVPSRVPLAVTPPGMENGTPVH